MIIFHKIDRNARNEYDYYTTKHLLQQTGIRYEYSKQDIDSNTPEGQMMESVMVGMAAYYSRNLANEIKKGSVKMHMRENRPEAVPLMDIQPIKRNISLSIKKKLRLSD